MTPPKWFAKARGWFSGTLIVAYRVTINNNRARRRAAPRAVDPAFVPVRRPQEIFLAPMPRRVRASAVLQPARAWSETLKDLEGKRK